ncbi:hypothetical protein V6N13_034665 [Hibiscus sabdariffa]
MATVSFLLPFITAVLLLTPSSSLTSQPSDAFPSNTPMRFLGKHYTESNLSANNTVTKPGFSPNHLTTSASWISPSSDSVTLSTPSTGLVHLVSAQSSSTAATKMTSNCSLLTPVLSGTSHRTSVP